MSKQITPIEVSESIRQRFSVAPPLFLSADIQSIKLELKPYLQPFEKELAMRELRTLLDSQKTIIEQYGYYSVETDKPEEFFQRRLTYWQRVGRSFLEPTTQKFLEFTQNGLSGMNERRELHNARRLRYGPHDLHEYRGKFFPQLVRSLINISGVSDDALVLDPMCGSGTTPCEVVASGRSVISADLNPLSILIAGVKSAIVLDKPKTFLETVSACLEEFRFKNINPEDIWSECDLTYLKRWFDIEAIYDLASILDEITKVSKPLYRNFFKICLSDIIRSVSWQKDTDLRVRKEIKPYNPGAAIASFKEQAYEQLDKIYTYLCVLPRFSFRPAITIRHGNAVNIAEIFPEYYRKVDLMITSPPYATALPYLDTDRLSLIILGLLPWQQHKDIEIMMVGTREVTERQRSQEWDRYLRRKNELPGSVSKLIHQIAKYNHGDTVGFRRRNLPALLGKYFLEMLDAMKSAHSLMVSGAHGYYVVGNNSTLLNEEKIQIPTDKLLFEIGEVAGWKAEDTVSMELMVSRDIFKDNRGSSEAILCFRA